MGDTPLVILDSPYRSLTEPLIEYVQKLRTDDPEAYIHLVLGGLTADTFWGQSLHRNSTSVINQALRNLEGIGITNIPYHLHTLHNGEGK